MRKHVWLAVLLTVAFLSGLAPAAKTAKAGGIRVFVNGHEVRYRGGAAPYEVTSGGRLMVPVRQTVNAIPCTRVTWFEEDQRERIAMSADCDGYSWDVWADMIMGSRQYDLHDHIRPWPLDADTRLTLDVPVVLRNDVVYAPARIIADTFKCLSWWDDDAYAMFIDCNQPARIHQSLESVMAANPPELDEANDRFVPPLVDGGYPMYPRTLAAYSTYVAVASNVLRAVNADVASAVTTRYETDAGRVRLVSKWDPTRVYGYQYGGYLQVRLDVGQQIDFGNRLKRAKSMTSGFELGGMTILGALVPGSAELRAALAALGSVGGIYVGFIKDSDLDNYAACQEKAKYNARRAGLSEDSAIVTVAIRWPSSIHCIPADTGPEVLTWADFARRGY